MRVVSIEEFHDRGWRWVAEEARRIVGEGPAYFSFDIDSLDPAYAPGTGTPEPGGLTTLEAQRLIRELGGHDFVGAIWSRSRRRSTPAASPASLPPPSCSSFCACLRRPGSGGGPMSRGQTYSGGRHRPQRGKLPNWSMLGS